MIAARAFGRPAAANCRAPFIHVSAAQTVQAIVALCQCQRIALPAALVEGHSVGMSGQHEAARTAAQCGDEVSFVAVCADVLYFNPKAHIGEPASQQVYYRAIALIPSGVGGADRGRAHQLPEMREYLFIEL